MGESPRMTIVCEPGGDSRIVALIPQVHFAHGQGRMREEAPGQRDRRKAEAAHSA